MTTTSDYRRVRIEENEVGIVGLQQAISEVAESCDHHADAEIRDALVERLSRKNYIPSSAREAYGKALLREFRQELGLPTETELPESVRVVLVGPGCAMCTDLEQTVLRVLSDLNLAAAFEHVTDEQQIARYGRVRPPALIINNTVVIQGTVPSIQRIRSILEEAVSQLQR